MHFLAPRDFAPIASTVEGILQSFRLLPLVLITLVKPHGHGFKVTPKGSDAGLSREDRFTILAALGLILATGTGMMLNADFSTRIVGAGELPDHWSLPCGETNSVWAAIAVPVPTKTAAIHRINVQAVRRMLFLPID